MKYLKKFNEELNPDSYYRAAHMLKRKHPERASKLFQHAEEVKDNLYSFWFKNKSLVQAFQMPLEFKYNDSRYNHTVSICGGPDIYLGNKEKIEEELQSKVSEYKKGKTELYLTFGIPFELSPRHQHELGKLIATNQLEKTGLRGDGIGMARSLAGGHSQIMLKMKVELSDNLYLEDDDGNWVQYSEEEFPDVFDDVLSVYVNILTNTKMMYYTNVSKTDDILFSISNRGDALKFKRSILPKLIEYFKPIIYELFSEHLQVDVDCYEKTMKKVENLSTNEIYHEKDYLFRK